MRPLYLIGWGYIAIATLLVSRAEYAAANATGVVFVQPSVMPAGPPGLVWFLNVKSRCNALEVELTMTRTPAPDGWEGTGYAAACFALAGKTARAQVLIDALAQAEQSRAAGIVFDIGHPVADAGDDESAGPIMELVLRYWPDHYMALYHAGIAQHRTGHRELARKNLEAFLRIYKANDGWTGSAEAVLKELRVGAGQ